MNKKQINDFIKLTLPREMFSVKFATNDECEGGAAAVDDNNIIYLNKDLFKTYSDNEQKCIILHEVGHILCGDSKSPSMTEYRAHLTAISIANALGLPEVIKELDSSIRSWIKYSWNEDKGEWRSHIIAARRYIKTYGKENRLCK